MNQSLEARARDPLPYIAMCEWQACYPGRSLLVIPFLSDHETLNKPYVRRAIFYSQCNSLRANCVLSFIQTVRVRSHLQHNPLHFAARVSSLNSLRQMAKQSASQPLSIAARDFDEELSSSLGNPWIRSSTCGTTKGLKGLKWRLRIRLQLDDNVTH